MKLNPLMVPFRKSESIKNSTKICSKTTDSESEASPDRSENPFLFSLKKEKIATDSRIGSLEKESVF